MEYANWAIPYPAFIFRLLGRTNTELRRNYANAGVKVLELSPLHFIPLAPIDQQRNPRFASCFHFFTIYFEMFLTIW